MKGNKNKELSFEEQSDLYLKRTEETDDIRKILKIKAEHRQEKAKEQDNANKRAIYARVSIREGYGSNEHVLETTNQNERQIKAIDEHYKKKVKEIYKTTSAIERTYNEMSRDPKAQSPEAQNMLKDTKQKLEELKKAQDEKLKNPSVIKEGFNDHSRKEKMPLPDIGDITPKQSKIKDKSVEMVK